MSERPKPRTNEKKKIAEPFWKRNRRFFIPVVLAGSIAGAGIGGFLLGNKQANQRPTPSPELTMTPEPTINNSAIIINKARELNFHESQAEIDLWKDAYQYQEASFDTSDQETIIEITKNRFSDTLERMGRSENPRFREAYKIIKEKFADVTTIEITLDTDSDIIPSVTSDLTDITYGVSTDFILNRSSALTLATQITAATTQVDSMVSYIKDFTLDFPNTDLYFDRDAQLEAYAEAYAVSSEAFILQSGLLGETFETPISGVDDRSLEYVKFGMNPRDVRWINYIESIAFNDLPLEGMPQQLS